MSISHVAKINIRPRKLLTGQRIRNDLAWSRVSSVRTLKAWQSWSWTIILEASCGSLGDIDDRGPAPPFEDPSNAFDMHGGPDSWDLSCL
jgi:hypothetical protein